MVYNERKNTHFLITVDVETFFVNNRVLPFEANIYGKIEGIEYGVNKIMEICNKFNAKATFFVDVYMCHRFGEDELKDLCCMIREKGHDVQLHAHANWIPNCDSEFLSAYSVEEQTDIIREGKYLLKKWLGVFPVAFRAGAYGLNLDTIRALENNDFVIDSSYFPFHPNCLMSKELNNLSMNKVFRIGKVFEFPVSTYWLVKNFMYKKNSKLDFNACSIQEFKDIIPKFIRSDIKYVILFLHSFSFVKWNRNFTSISPDDRTLDRLERTLDFLSTYKNVDFLMMRDTALRLKSLDEGIVDFSPNGRMINLVPRLVNRFL